MQGPYYLETKDTNKNMLSLFLTMNFEFSVKKKDKKQLGQPSLVLVCTSAVPVWSSMLNLVSIVHLGKGIPKGKGVKDVLKIIFFKNYCLLSSVIF
jgi:hypothetical protein